MEHLEGRESILAALQAGQRRFSAILVRRGSHAEKFADVVALAELQNIPIRIAEGAELDALAHGATHGGILAIATAKPRMTGDAIVEFAASLHEPALMLLMEGIDDARNLGFVLRSADALGFHAALIKKHLWDFDSVEISRPASGAYERLPLAQIEDVSPIRELQKRGIRLIGCIAGAKRTIYDVDLTGPTLLAIGGEKRGLSGAVREICDLFITIPTRADASSLSLSHAAAIVMAEAMRQRIVEPGGRRPLTTTSPDQMGDLSD